MKKSTRRICYIVLALFALMTFTGCPSCGGKVLSDKLTKHLNEKYDKEFKITKLVKEFDGDHGWHYRAVFHEKDSQENSVLYCYKDDLDEGTIIRINGIKHAVVDDYADIILQEQYAALIQEELGEDVLVKCRLLTLNYMMTEEEFEKGLSAGLDVKGKDNSVSVYVLANTKQIEEGLREQTEEIMKKYPINSQYLYVCFLDSLDVEEWDKIYYENDDAYSDEFTRYLKENDSVRRIEFTSFSSEVGLKETKVIKE